MVCGQGVNRGRMRGCAHGSLMGGRVSVSERAAWGRVERDRRV